MSHDSVTAENNAVTNPYRSVADTELTKLKKGFLLNMKLFMQVANFGFQFSEKAKILSGILKK